MSTKVGADHKMTLEGVRRLACQLANADPKLYRVKIGGHVLGARAKVDFYISAQNVDASINTQKAQKLKLVRRCFGIFQQSEGDPVQLRISEWSAEQDFGSEYRITWVADDSMKARQELANLMSASIKDLEPKGG